MGNEDHGAASLKQGTTSDHATSAAPRVRILQSVSEIEEFRNIWMRLQWHPNADIDFYLMVLQSLPGVLRPHVLVAHWNGSPAALLVGRLEDSQLNFKIGYAGFLRPRVRALTFVYGGLLGNPSAPTCEAFVREVIKSLRQGEADIAFFNHLRADSPLHSALTRSWTWLSRDYFPVLQIHRKMTLPGKGEEFWPRFSPKFRKNQRWQARKLLNDHSGNVTIRCFRESSELGRMVCDVEHVARKTYQRSLGVGFVDTTVMRQQLETKAAKGWLRAYVLYVSGRPCAFWLGALYKATFHSDSMGYDPEYSKYSPGMYLIMRVIEDISNQGEVRAIDFGLGDAQYKQILGNVQWQDVSAYIFGPTLRSLGLSAIRTPASLIDRAAKMVLEESALLVRIKKLWRKHLISQALKDAAVTVNVEEQSAQRREHESVSVE